MTQRVLALVADQHLVHPGGLAVQAGVAAGHGHVLQQPVRAPEPASLLVAHQGQRQLPPDRDIELVEQHQRQQGGHRSGLHVTDAAAEDAAVPALTGVGIKGPGLWVAGRELVQVAVEDEVAAGLAALHIGDQALHRRLRLVHVGRQPLRLQVAG